jgi:hypothetical protein
VRRRVRGPGRRRGDDRSRRPPRRRPHPEGRQLPAMQPRDRHAAQHQDPIRGRPETNAPAASFSSVASASSSSVAEQDQLGHTSNTVTERHYINRKLVVPDYRAAIERPAPGFGSDQGTAPAKWARLRPAPAGRQTALSALEIPAGPESTDALRVRPRADSASSNAARRMTRACSSCTESRVLSSKCAMRRVGGGRRLHRESLRRRSEPVFASRATHSTWLVIGKTYMTLSVSATHCGQRRAGGATGL